MTSRFFGVEVGDASEFCERLVASSLISPSRFGELLAEYSAAYSEASSRSTRTLSEFLIANRIITRWQVEKLLEGRYEGFFIDHYMLVGHVRAGEEYSTFAAIDTVTRQEVLIDVSPPLIVKGRRAATPRYRVRER